MKQLLQNMRDGKTIIADVPVPHARSNTALVRTSASLVSAGTERMVVEFAGKNLVGKARSRPDLVRQVIGKARREGIFPTLEVIFNRLDQPMALGYSSTGTIIELGTGLHGFKVGDRVACAGGGYAVHAEYAVVPQNLLALLPTQVDDDSAAFVTLAAIALHGFRLANPQIGERVAVIGLGLLGLLTSGIACAAGCTVFGIDLDQERIKLGERMGATCVLRSEAESSGSAFTGGRGFDTILICADTHSNDPIELAAQLARDRASVIAIGAVGLNISRKPFYEKELKFIVSRSYGPGRYDPHYEEDGQDYPMGYVRWSEGRNLEAVIDMLASRRLDVHPLITHRFPIEQADEAYRLITGKREEPFLGVLLTYSHDDVQSIKHRIQINQGTDIKPDSDKLFLGVLGAGNFASAVFLPNVVKTGKVQRAIIASGSGLNAQNAARRYGFTYAASSEDEVLNDPNINIVAILDRHQHHARQVVNALQRGKHVYCEKPLALNEIELEEIAACLTIDHAPLLTVGFNRRFAPLAQTLKTFLKGCGEPFYAQYRINAGFIPLNHWLHDPIQGGGRIIGEGCHFIDFLSFLNGDTPIAVQARGLPDNNRYQQDNVSMTFTFKDGSIGNIAYLANGDKSFPKERIEVFCASHVAVLDDFRKLELVKNGKRKLIRSTLGQDKGHRHAWDAFLDAVLNSRSPTIPYDHLLGVTRASFAAVKALSSMKEEAIL